MSPTRTFWLSAFAVFLVIFNLGYVFHDLAAGAWFHAQQPFSREHYIIPLIAVAFAVYALIVAHLYPVWRARYADGPTWWAGLRFGWLMGIMFDALQGGLIEVATFQMPFAVFAVDTSYHVFVEGSITGLIVAAVHARSARRSVALA